MLKVKNASTFKVTRDGFIKIQVPGQVIGGISAAGYLNHATVRFKDISTGEYIRTDPAVVLTDHDGAWSAKAYSTSDVIEVEVEGGTDKTTGSINTIKLRAMPNLKDGDIKVTPISTITAALIDDELIASMDSIATVVKKSENKTAIAFGIDVADLRVDPYKSDRADLVRISTNIQIAAKSFVNASLDPSNADAISNAVASLATEVVKDIDISVNDTTGEVINNTSAEFKVPDLQDETILQSIGTRFVAGEVARGSDVNVVMLSNSKKNVCNAIAVVNEQGSISDILKMKKVSIDMIVKSPVAIKRSDMRSSVCMEPSIAYKSTTSMAPIIEFCDGYGQKIEVDKRAGYIEDAINKIVGPKNGVTLTYNEDLGVDGWYGDYRRVPSSTDWTNASLGTIYIAYQCRNGIEVTTLVQPYEVIDSMSPVINWNDGNDEELDILVGSTYDETSAVQILMDGAAHGVVITGNVLTDTVGTYVQKYQALNYANVFLERVISVVPRPPVLIPLVSDPFQVVDGIYILARIHRRVDLDLNLNEYIPVAEIWRGGAFVKTPITSPSGMLELTRAYHSKQAGDFTLTYNVGDDMGQILTATRLVTLYPEPADKTLPAITLSSTDDVTVIQFIGPLPSLAASVDGDNDAMNLRVRPVHSGEFVGPEYTLTSAASHSTGIAQLNAAAFSVVGTTRLGYSCVDNARNEAIVKYRNIEVLPLNGHDLSGMDLRMVTFVGTVDITGCDLTNTIFTSTQLDFLKLPTPKLYLIIEAGVDISHLNT